MKSIVITIGFFIFFVTQCLQAHSTEQFYASENVNGAFTFYEVHVWPDNQCDLCHISPDPDDNNAALVTDDPSLLCEPCHEGTSTAIDDPDFNANPVRLDNHPIKFSPLNFDPDKISHSIMSEGNNFFVQGESGRVRLFGETRESAVAECSTCHDPHGKSGLPFLQRSSLSEEEFCVICHINIANNQ
jgi:predicted CXXCH cytochrome family protein